jgi:hypothetical protein
LHPFNIDIRNLNVLEDNFPIIIGNKFEITKNQSLPHFLLIEGFPYHQASHIHVLTARNIGNVFSSADICVLVTGTCFIQKIYAPSSSLLQGKHLPFSPSPLRLNIFRLFVILSLTQLYRYTPKIFLLSTATFKYTYRAPLRRIGQEKSANVA